MEFRDEWEDVFRRGQESLYAFLRGKGYDIDESVARHFFDHFYEQHHIADRTLVEYTATQAIQATFQKFNLNHAGERLFAEALDAFFLPELEGWHPREGSVEVLRQLTREGYKVGLISNASHHPFIMQCLQTMGYAPFLDPAITSAAFAVRKPHPDIFDHVKNYWKLKPEEICMIGDQPYFDIFGAHQAGMKAVGFAERFEKAHTFIPESLMGDPLLIPEASIRHLSELPKVLKSL